MHSISGRYNPRGSIYPTTPLLGGNVSSVIAMAVEPTFGREGLRMELPANSKGIGKVITRPDSDTLISGVRILPYPIWPDCRGYFQEIIRFGEGLVSEFPAATTQVSAALSYPGTVKAFHFHLEQTDVWSVVTGQLQVALVDLRSESPTFGRRNTIYIGPLRPWQVLIPPGVGHGYKATGEEKAILVYATNKNYNPKDEGRIAYDDPGINYDWDPQYK